MPRRIDVELTSARDDGTWTWRAAGAKQPKGVVTADLLYAGAKVGDVVVAEADFDIDGITITSVTPPRTKATPGNLIEVTGSGGDFEPVTTSLVSKGERTGRDRDRGPRRDGDRPPRAGGDRGSRSPADRTGAPGSERGPHPDRGDRGDRAAKSAATRDWRGRPPGADRGRPAGPERGQPRPAGPRREPSSRPQAERGRPSTNDRPRPKRLSPGNKHRAAVLESLSPEERAVAEQVLRGGIPAVRRAIADQNAQARAAGQPEIPQAPLLGLAEQLLPRLKTAEWRDRAEAAMAEVEEIGLRDLRSVVSSADAAARDEETRALAGALREALERRVKQQQDAWIAEITAALTDGRLVRALRTAARPPDPAMRFPADLAMRLSAEASEAMAADTPAERWSALLEAVAASPVRTTVKPAALPADAPEPLLQTARQHAGRIPALTALLGLSMPPPPGPVRRIPPKPQRPPVPPPPAPPAPADPPSAPDGA